MSGASTLKQTTQGLAIVERLGWEEDEEGNRRFTATLVFENGPPDLPFNTIWDRRPVCLVLKGHADHADAI